LERTSKQEAANQKVYYEGQIANYISEVERAKFNFYYVKPKQRYGVDDLEEYIDRWKWGEGAYEEHGFDCSQMSAHIERRLENEGYHTVIVTGDSPWGDGKHAWLLVETNEGKYMPVEATSYSIVYWNSPHFDNYFKYEHRFETIHEAHEYSSTEFSWWD